MHAGLESTSTRTWHVVDTVELGEVAPLLLRVRVIRVNALEFTSTLEEAPATPTTTWDTAFAVLGRHAVELVVLAYGHLRKGGGTKNVREGCVSSRGLVQNGTTKDASTYSLD